MEISGATEGLATGAGVVGFALLIFHRVWRVLNRERVDVKREGAEVDMLRVLRDENKLLRERADMFAKERNEAQRELGALRAEVPYLREEVARLRRQLRVMGIGDGNGGPHDSAQG